LIEREKNLAVTRGFPYPALQEAVGVAEDQACLILVLDTSAAATVRTVPQSGAKTFERAGLNGVVDTHIAFPLGLITATAHGFDVVAVQVGNRGSQTWNTQCSEVVRVLTEGGVFTARTKELIMLSVNR